MSAGFMEQAHKLDLDTFEVEVLIDGEGMAEVIFGRSGKPVFRAGVEELRTALSFVEKHGDVILVERR